MQEERFTLLAGLYLSGEASPAEREELEELLRRNPEWEPKLAAFRRIWLSHPKGTVKKEDAYRRHLQRLEAHLYAHTPPAPSATQTSATPPPVQTSPVPSAPAIPAPGTHRLRKWWVAAAVAASLAGAFVLIHQLTNNTPIPVLAPRTVSTPSGARSRLTLPDGTTVILNADSRLTFDEHFTAGTREIQLSGEAYFDVAKDPHRPFLIHTPVVDIKVLGTIFNVRSYENEKTTETDLLQGAVEVTLHNKPDKKIILKPNEKLTVLNDQAGIPTGQPIVSDNNDAPMIAVSKVHYQKKDSSITEVLWTKNSLAFDNTSLEDVTLLLQRWYGITVTITDEKLKKVHLNGYFVQENLRQVMEALSIAGNFTYTIRGNEVIITP